jgi:hypothetical protein
MDYWEKFLQQRLLFFAESRCILVVNTVKMIMIKISKRKVSQSLRDLDEAYERTDFSNLHLNGVAIAQTPYRPNSSDLIAFSFSMETGEFYFVFRKSDILYDTNVLIKRTRRTNPAWIVGSQSVLQLTSTKAPTSFTQGSNHNFMHQLKDQCAFS